MISCKEGASLADCRAPILRALIQIGNYYGSRGLDCVVTSGAEQWPGHAETSAHYRGDAVDVRLHTVAQADRMEFVRQVQALLGMDYQVMREGSGTGNEHLHVQWSPRVKRL